MVNKKGAKNSNNFLLVGIILIAAAFLFTNTSYIEESSPLSGLAVVSEAQACNPWLSRDTNLMKYGTDTGPFDIDNPSAARCIPKSCPSGYTFLGFLDEYNEYNRWHNRFNLCVQDPNAVGEVVKCKYVEGNTICALPTCTQGTLQFKIEERHREPSTNAVEITNYGVCANIGMKTVMCAESDFDKTRSCSTVAPSGYTKMKTPAEITGNWRIGQASFMDRYVPAPGNPNFAVNYYFWDIYVSDVGVATCSDGIKNQGETGVDCGGPCAACAPTCSDGIKNQDETDVDCGGSTCSGCGFGKYCNTASDCTVPSWMTGIANCYNNICSVCKEQGDSGIDYGTWGNVSVLDGISNPSYLDTCASSTILNERSCTTNTSTYTQVIDCSATGTTTSCSNGACV